MAVSDPDKFKSIQGRLKEVRQSHSTQIDAKPDDDDRFVNRVAGCVIGEFRWLWDEYARLQGNEKPTDATKHGEVETQLQELEEHNGAAIVENRFVKRIEASMFKNMEWLVRRIAKLAAKAEEAELVG